MSVWVSVWLGVLVRVWVCEGECLCVGVRLCLRLPAGTRACATPAPSGWLPIPVRSNSNEVLGHRKVGPLRTQRLLVQASGLTEGVLNASCVPSLLGVHLVFLLHQMP